MKYRIEERDGLFISQFKFLWWWEDFDYGFSFCDKERAVQQIKKHHKYREPAKSIYHYIYPQDLN